jgi:2-polyprenyl-3-methyl-5-hydroxy-6-metoxy-1,4-benzoquinol methylase
MEYTDEKLQSHELNFWINSYTPPFFHLKFYESFFNFKELSGKKTVDIGCGGAPISDYCGVDDINLTIVDPLINDLIVNDKFKHLSKYNYFSGSLFDLVDEGFEYLVCLNVVDHFNDPEYSFVEKFHSLLTNEGFLWLYYDVRSINSGDHLAINNTHLINKIEKYFEILKIDNSINPKHKGWSNVNESIRIIGKKK